MKNLCKSNNIGDSNSEFEFQSVASLQCTARYLNGPQFILNGKADVSIGESVTVPIYDTKNGIGGCLQMACPSQIVISEKVKIIGRGRGMMATIDAPVSTSFNVGAVHQVHREAVQQNLEKIRCPKDHKIKRVTLSADRKNVKCHDCSRTLHSGFSVYRCTGAGSCKFYLCVRCMEKRVIPEDLEGAGGGAVSLISSDGVTNNGVMDCTASNSDSFSGGTVFISTDGHFENNGNIDCGQDGTVIVDCAQFVNSGSIIPAPNVVMREDKVVLPWITSMTSKIQEEPMELTVSRWRGHYSSYHPQNLLEKGVEKVYVSNDSLPGKGDWIEFQVVSESRFIPTKVTIRNRDNEQGIKRFALCGGRKESEFEDWIEVNGVHQRNREIQTFPIDVASRYMAWRGQYNCFKMVVHENYRANSEGYHMFYELVLYGIKVD